jgi:Carboxypeptidase regulatory-like domain
VSGTLVAGRVVDLDGRPVHGASVMFSGAPGPVPDVAELTGADGGFALAAPEAGRYVISVRAPGGATGEIAVDVGAEPPEELEISLTGPDVG